jgi:hypothetical protein
MEMDPQTTAAAIGKKIATEILVRRRVSREKRAKALDANNARIPLSSRVAGAHAGALPPAAAHTAGFLVAVGDSWFDYPFHDVLSMLDEQGYNVEATAHRGDRIEAMAYEGGQIDRFARCVEKVTDQGATPKAILVSGGGNDIAGTEFGMLLNSAVSSTAGWNADVLAGVIDQRILTAYRSIIASINTICVDHIGGVRPIVIHGYDYPVPDGRGFLGGWPFPGPWLQPGFREKGYSDLPQTVQQMRLVIDRFNDGLRGLEAEPACVNVHYLNLRGTLSSALAADAYQADWANELHPTQRGFEAVTAKFVGVLQGLP